MVNRLWQPRFAGSSTAQRLRQFQQRSLSLKLTALITSLVVTVVGATTLLSIQREQRNFRAELKQQAALLADSLSITLKDPLYRLDVSLLRDFVQTLSQYDQVFSAAYLYDAQGRLLADASQSGPIYELEADPLGQQILDSVAPQFEWNDDELVVSRVITIGNQPVGAIRLGLSTQSLQQKIAAVRNRGFGAAAIAAVLSALLARWLSRSITQPIHKLVQGTQQISQGNFEHPIHIQTKDELSVLADAFNDMGRQLQQTLGLLAQQNEDLEVRVKQRTETLTQTLHDLQEAQAQLIQSEKMSGLGQMVAGIAHEINNPVSFIHGNLPYLHEYTQSLLELTQLYRKHHPKPHPEIVVKADEIDLPFLVPDLAKVLNSMTLGTDRIREIVLSLRNFARTDEAAAKVVDVHEGIDSTLMILAHRLKANTQRPAIQVTKDYGDIPEIACYPSQLNQVFMNILSNAIDALEESNLGLPYGDLETHPNQIHIQTQIPQSDCFRVVIQDNGPGISKAVRSKLFDPFFTTKPVGKGTGLGLSISYQIITERHGGKLFCDSIPEQGTTFVIELPVHQNVLDSGL